MLTLNVKAAETASPLEILVVEDDEDDFVLIDDLLRTSGMGDLQLSRCERLSDAMSLAHTHPFDIAVLDLGLPDSRGVDTLHRFRAELPDLPVVVLTGHDDEVLASDSLRDGAQDYLAKSWLEADLFARTIQYAIKRKSFEDRQRHQLRLQAVIAELGSLASVTDRLNELSNAVVDRITSALDCEFGAILQHLPEEQFVLVRAAKGWPGSAPRLELEQVPHVYDVIEARQSLRLTRGADGWPSSEQMLADHGIRSGLLVPIPGDDSRLYGVLGVHSLREVGFSDQEELFLQAVANVLASAVGRVRAVQTGIRQRAFFQRLVESLHEGLLVTDPQGAIAYINPTAVSLFRTSEGDLIGRTVPSLASDSTAVEALSTTQRDSEDQADRECELELVRGDKTRFYAALKARSFLDEGGGEGTIYAVTDISEQKKLEQQFQQVQKMDAIGRLAGGIAHDFNNYLTAINGFSEILLLETDDASMRSGLTEISSAGRRAAALTRQLLAFSRQQVLQARPLDLNLIFQDLQKMLRRLIGENIGFESDLGEQLPAVLADPSQIEQIIINLVVNARDAMISGGTLRCKTEALELTKRTSYSAEVALSAGNYIVMSVSDTGIGIAPELLSQIFEPFFTTKGRSEGTGLGLATVYGIVKQSGGYVFADSEVGKGTTVRVILPEFKGTESRPTEARVARSKVAKSRGQARILVVEDEAAVRRFLVHALERAEYDVRAAVDGQEALDLIENPDVHFDLVLSDVVMPRMSGPELGRAIADRFDAPTVVFMTGYIENRDDSLEELARDFTILDKPFTQQTLVKAIQEALSSGDQ